ncbi:MAG: DUF2807 domain-containing protein [Chloroflexi bacterium]|nr:DUF2807 domain-containing protein [Chloroflexota bacterium]
MLFHSESTKRTGRSAMNVIRKQSRVILLLAFCTVVIMLASCVVPGYGAATGSGRVVTKDLGFTNFDAVDASSAFAVNPVRSDSYKVVVSIDDNLVDSLDASQQGKTVTIGLKPGSYANTHLKVDVTMPALTGLKLSGACVGSVSGFQSTSGLTIDLSGASRLNGQLASGDMHLTASGASKATVQGSAANLVLDLSGASNADLGSLPAKDVSADLSGASQATVNTNGNLDADLSGASKLFYTGSPHLGRVNTSGASEISRK